MLDKHKKTVAIVIPTHRDSLTIDDKTSILHLNKFLGKYPKYFVVPENLKLSKLKKTGFKIVTFPKKYFSSWRGYNEMLLEKKFYIKFKKYDYILIYQLDVLVFSNQLEYWCNKNYDYIAAPWFKPVIGYLSHKKGCPASGGNGGFSLRKVSNALKVLEKVEKYATKQSASPNIRRLWFLWAILTGKSHQIWLNAPASNYPFAEDGFWSLEAPKYLSNYRVADFKTALKFGFERFPRKCFELNHKKLPFGVHAWKKYDEEFWKPYIIKQGP